MLKSVRSLFPTPAMIAGVPGQPSTSKLSSSSSSSSTSSTLPSASASPYLITTKSGTSMSDFTNFIQTFPDNGQGQQIAYPHVSFQGYITSINSSYAAIVAQNPIVNSVVIDAPLSENANSFDAHTETSILAHETPVPGDLNGRVRKRAPSVPTNNLVRQPDSQIPLKIISQGIANNQANVLEDYLFDPIAGEGITIYILDSGFFQGATVSGFTYCYMPISDS
jgi:hypothetical protein